jgi:hypothetical protein
VLRIPNARSAYATTVLRHRKTVFTGRRDTYARMTAGSLLRMASKFLRPVTHPMAAFTIAIFFKGISARVNWPGNVYGL